MQSRTLLWVALLFVQCLYGFSDEGSGHPATGDIKYVDIDEPRFHEFEATDWKGKHFSFERLEGYVTIVMNVQWNWSKLGNILYIHDVS